VEAGQIMVNSRIHRPLNHLLNAGRGCRVSCLWKRSLSAKSSSTTEHEVFPFYSDSRQIPWH